MIEFFLEIPMELQVIILSCLTMGVIQFIKDEKEKNRQEYESKKSVEARTSNNRKYKTTYKDIKKYFKVLNKALFKNILQPFNDIQLKDLKWQKNAMDKLYNGNGKVKAHNNFIYRCCLVIEIKKNLLKHWHTK